MKWQSFRFLTRRKPIRRPAARTRLAIEELESRLLLSTNVLTWQYDNANGGVNSNETQLNTSNVAQGSFGKLFNTAVDGQIYAQPLVDTGVTISNGPNTAPGAAGVHNVVFVATENDSLYAIDADPGSSGDILWQRSFLDAGNSNDALAGATSVTPVPYQDATDQPDIAPNFGITSTPVIDASTNTMYVVTATKEMVGGVAHYVQRLHAINISNGTDTTASYVIGDTVGSQATGQFTNNTSLYVYGDGPGSVTDPYNGTGKQVVQFNALMENQRSALRLVNGTLYAAWASHGDSMPYYGWIAAWNVSNVASNGLQLAGVLNTGPNDPTNGGENGVWESSAGLSFTPDGKDFYFVTGNSPAPVSLDANGNPTGGNYNEAIVEATLPANPSTTPQNQGTNGWGFQIVQYFIPADANWLGYANLDMATDVALLPASAGIPGHTNLAVAGNKAGQLYLLDANNLGGYEITNQNILNGISNSPADANIPPSFTSGTNEFDAPSYFNAVLSSPVYFDGELYVIGGSNDPAKAFSINSDGSLTVDSQTVSSSFGFAPGSPTISANGTKNGIVWIVDRATNQLEAYDAANLGDELWSSGQGSNALGSAIKFAPPTVANGMVFVGTSNSLVVYGLTSSPPVSQTPTLSVSPSSNTSVKLSWQDPSQPSDQAYAYQIEESTDGVHFTQVATATAGSTTLYIGGLIPDTTYYFRIRGLHEVGASAYSNVVTVTPTSVIDFSGGFANSTSQLSYNGAAAINGNSAQLTDGGQNELASVFTGSSVDITGFQSQFTFQVSPGSTSTLGDGFTFTIQGNSPFAVGATGGALGYGPSGPGSTGSIPNSVAIKFDLYDNQGEGNDSTGLYLDGAMPTVPSIDLTKTGINLHSGDTFQVNLSYDGTTLTVVIKDTVTGATATQQYAVNIPAAVGSDTAYVGFTAGSGGATAIQNILNWTFEPTSLAAPALPTAFQAAPTSGNSVALSWTNNSTNQTGFYLDRATDAGFTQNLITQTLPGTASGFTDTANGLTPGGTYYYRLRAFNSEGSSAYTATQVVAIPTIPPMPTSAAITGVTSNSISMTWTDTISPPATYQIYRSTGGAFALVANLPNTASSWTDTTVSAGTSYVYHIVAATVSGSHGWVGIAATTSQAPSSPPAPPAPPSSPSAPASTSLLSSLIQLEMDAFLLLTYFEEGDSAEALQIWSDIAANPLLQSPLGLFALEQGLAMAKH